MCKTIATILLVAIFLASGAHKLNEPQAVGEYIKSSPSVQLALEKAKFTPTTEEYTMAAQAVGGFQVACATFIILGLGRSFFATILAFSVLAITACMHIDLNQPEAILKNQAEMIHVLKNLSIFGGLMVLACGNCGTKCPPAASTKAPSPNKKRQ